MNEKPSDEALLAQKRLEQARRAAGLDRRGHDPRSGDPQRISTSVTMLKYKEIADRAIAGREHDPVDLDAYRQQEFERRERSIESKRISWAIDESNIPRLILDEIMSQSCDVSSEIVLGTLAMLAAQKRIVGLLGPTWTGKTMAACWALWSRRLEHDQARLDGNNQHPDMTGRFITATRITWIPEWELATHWAMNVPFLVLDDLGCELSSNRSTIEEVLIERYNAALITVFTTNLSRDEFVEAYDDRLISRIKRVGEFAEFSQSFDPMER